MGRSDRQSAEKTRNRKHYGPWLFLATLPLAAGVLGSSLDPALSGAIVAGWVAVVSIWTWRDHGRLRNRCEDAVARAEQAERQRRTAATRTERFKENFLRNLSHEFRTPMNGIVGMSEILLEGKLAEEDREGVELIKRCSSAYLELIEDLLELTRLELGTPDLEEDVFDLRKLMTQAVDVVSPEAKRKGLSVLLVFPETTTRFFVGDAQRLRQILTKLMDNAVKFTEEGGIELAARVRNGGMGKVGLRCTVKDTGCGVEPDAREEIFDAFVKGEGSSPGHLAGLGMGLTIAKGLTELMGGSIGIESAPGRGTTFTVDLQLDVPASPEDDEAPIWHRLRRS